MDLNRFCRYLGKHYHKSAISKCYRKNQHLETPNFLVSKTKKKYRKQVVFGTFYDCGRRVRVSGGHLCAMHRSTDRGGSRDLEPIRTKAVPLLARLRCPKLLCALERHAVLTAAPNLHFLYPPPAVEAKLHPALCAHSGSSPPREVGTRPSDKNAKKRKGIPNGIPFLLHERKVQLLYNATESK